jgi:squalene-hopene/tetraprenyl-beta-curcumene cyclase
LIALSHLLDLVPDAEPQPSTRALVRGTLRERVTDPARVDELPRLRDLSWDDRPAVRAGLWWLVCLENRNGGWPTFCRGWGKLPFDRSGCDLTAHVLRAFTAWKDQIDTDDMYVRALQVVRHRGSFAGFPLPAVEDEMLAGLAYLEKEQRPDGSWVPLWFGNQHAADDENPTYGTARVLAAYRDLDIMNTSPARRGVAWLLGAQNADGGWGGAAGTPSSIEETALALDVLVATPGADTPGSPLAGTVNKGLAWLVQQVEAGRLDQPTPIGFYFAKLWYFEKLYPVIFTVAALGRARLRAAGQPEPPHREALPRG